MRNNCSLLVLVPLLFFLSLLVPAALSLRCLKEEKTLLLKLKRELIFDSNYSTKLVMWSTETDRDCCEWDGVMCNEAGRVYRLYLEDESISGGLNESSSLFRLRYLEVLNLEDNALIGSLSDHLHFEGLSSLTHLYLRNNSLSGSIPHAIFALPSLQELDLSQNKLSGEIKLNDHRHFPIVNDHLLTIDLSSNSLSGNIPLSFFGNMTSLQELYLSLNQFSGEINEFPINVNYFSNLRYLSLEYNSLNGSIPHSFFALPSLIELHLSNNQFTEFLLSDENKNISNLVFIDLSHNLFVAATFQLIEKLILRVPNLKELNLSYNNLSVNDDTSNAIFPNLMHLSLVSCNLTKFPDFLKQTTMLSTLDLSSNQIAGGIPSWIWEIGNGTLSQMNLSANMLEYLQRPYNFSASHSTLDLHSNQLRGELPPLPQAAQYIDYSNNYFDSPIPSTFFENAIYYIKFLSLANNSLSGAIPTSFCSIRVAVLNLSFNNLSSIPPCLPGALQVLSLKGNNITGVVPDRFSADCDLRTLDLSNNNIGSKIPKSLANCTSLAVLNVGYNNFDDTFPCMLPSSLRVLVLRSNRFHGELGSSCTDDMKSWSSNLQIMDVSSNHFNGSLHGLNLANWRGMMMLQNGTRVRPKHSASDFLSGAFYVDEVRLTVKGIEVNVVKIWPEFTSIDLSCNDFQGGIPNAVGDLTSLYLLNLSHNALAGTIPKSLGALTELGSLDLSVNQLRGRIPEELAGLTFLSILNVSYNELVGTIPKGTQFQTFSADWFEGNAGLCGFPLNTSCSGSDGNHDPMPPKVEEEIEWEYVCAAVGYGVGLGIIAWIMLFWRGFRERYFDKIEEFVENTFSRRDQRRRRRRKRQRSSEVRRGQS